MSKLQLANHISDSWSDTLAEFRPEKSGLLFRRVVEHEFGDSAHLLGIQIGEEPRLLGMPDPDTIGTFTVEAAVLNPRYAALPAGQSIRDADYAVGNPALRRRLGFFTADGEDEWWDFEADDEQLVNLLRTLESSVGLAVKWMNIVDDGRCSGRSSDWDLAEAAIASVRLNS